MADTVTEPVEPDELTAPLMGALPGGPAPEPIIFIPSDRGSSLFGLLRESLGWTDEYIAEINDPYYPELKDIGLMVDALHEIRSSGRRIVVLPDFDMDGVTSGVLGYAGLAELGFNVGLYVPDYRRGHDIQPEAVDELVAQFPGVSAVITCDGGVNSHAGIGRGKQLGLTMLVTDHHMQLDHGSPADVIVNPMRIDEDYPHPGICGAFVLWQVLAAYARRYAPHKSRDIDLLKLFAGIGTVSDVMPLLYENRQLVRDSLAIARMLYVPCPRPTSPPRTRWRRRCSCRCCSPGSTRRRSSAPSRASPWLCAPSASTARWCLSSTRTATRSSATTASPCSSAAPGSCAACRR